MGISPKICWCPRSSLVPAKDITRTHWIGVWMCLSLSELRLCPLANSFFSVPLDVFPVLNPLTLHILWMNHKEIKKTIWLTEWTRANTSCLWHSPHPLSQNALLALLHWRFMENELQSPVQGSRDTTQAPRVVGIGFIGFWALLGDHWQIWGLSVTT